MSYNLIQLAPGAYDLYLADTIVASVVRSGLRQPYTWTAELLEDLPRAQAAVTLPGHRAQLPVAGGAVCLARPSTGEDQQPAHRLAGRVRAEAPRPRRCLKPRPGRWCAKGMTHILNVDHPAPAAMLLSAGRWLRRIGPAVCSAGYRHQRRNRPHHAGRAAGLIASRAHFRNQPYSSKVFVMPPTEVAAPDYSPAAPTFTQAAVRFAVSFAALIGLSLLLAGL